MKSSALRKSLILSGLVLVGIPAVALAKKPVSDGTPDLAADSITFKQKGKKKDPAAINNFTLIVDNLGDGDAKNSRIHYFLSDDDVLSTETDRFIHQHALGKLKAGKFKRRTVGGGILKKAANEDTTTVQYLIAYVDAREEVEELDEANNVVVSDPLP